MASVDIAQLLAFAVKNNASDLHLSAGVQPIIRVDGDVKHVRVLANAEFNVAGQAHSRRLILVSGTRRYEADLFPIGIHDEHTGPTRVADRQIDITLGVHAHSVTPFLLAEFDDRATISNGDLTIASNSSGMYTL